jgi:hypothetical protein
MRIYRSKIGIEILAPIILILGVTFYLHIVNEIWIGVVINSAVAIFITYLYTGTKYIIDDKRLFVKAGFLVNQTIPIQEIKCIARTNSILSSPALSLDRIQLFYGKSGSVIISPKDKNAFVNHLQQINPDIKYINRK